MRHLKVFEGVAIGNGAATYRDNGVALGNNAKTRAMDSIAGK